MSNQPIPETTPEETGNEQATGQEAAKTFTQDEVNQIVSKRVSEVKAKTENDAAAKEQELTRRETLLTAKERFHKEGYTASIVDVLNIQTVEDIDKCLLALKEEIDARTKIDKVPGFKIGGPGSNTNGNLPPPPDPYRKAMGLH